LFSAREESCIPQKAILSLQCGSYSLFLRFSGQYSVKKEVDLLCI